MEFFKHNLVRPLQFAQVEYRWFVVLFFSKNFEFQDFHSVMCLKHWMYFEQV
jgi:hypothetical protein